MITFINADGAIHTVPKEVYEAEFSHCRKLTNAQLKKMAELSAAIAEKRAIRFGDGDAETKRKATIEEQRLRAEEEKFRQSLISGD